MIWLYSIFVYLCGFIVISIVCAKILHWINIQPPQDQQEYIDDKDFYAVISILWPFSVPLLFFFIIIRELCYFIFSFWSDV